MESTISNIVLFVGDAVRYDHSKERLREIGQTYNTVAASLHTPASFASMLTGLNVPEHNVVGFGNVIPDSITSLVDLDEWNTYFSAKTGTMHEDMHRIFNMDDQAYLSEAEEPFIWVVRDPGGHAPYDKYDPDTYDQLDENGPEYLNRVAGQTTQLREEYSKGVNSSIDRFEDTVDYIQQQGIEDETLIIYTSDHGEILGEHGMLGHNHVACPELVYVPTTFVHPDIPTGTESDTIRHIDLFPSILDALDATDVDESQLSGRSIWDSTEGIGYNHFKTVFYNNNYLDGVTHEVKSCWDGDGGHVFVESSYRDAISLYLGVLTMSYKGKQIRSDKAYLTALKQLLPGHSKYGQPGFTKEEASEVVKEVNRGAKTGGPNSDGLDKETKQRLDDLGYI